MATEFMALVVTDAVLYLFLRVLMGLEWRGSNGHVPLWLALLVASGVVGLHIATSLYLVNAIDSPDTSGIVLTLFVLCGLPPIILAVHMVMDSLISGAVDEMYSWHGEAGAPRYDLSRARALMAANEIPSAIRELRRNYAIDGTNPEPLFEEAVLHENRGEWNEAEQVYRHIMDKFPKGTVPWLEGLYRTALLLERRRDFEGATTIFRQLVADYPYSRVGYLARERLFKHIVSA